MNLPLGIEVADYHDFVINAIMNQERVDPAGFRINTELGLIYGKNDLLIAVFRPIGDMVVFYWYENSLNRQFFKVNAERHYTFVRPEFRLGYQHDGSIGIFLDQDCVYQKQHKVILIETLRQLDTEIFDIEYHSGHKELSIKLRTPDLDLPTWKQALQQIKLLNGSLVLDLTER